MNMEITRNFMPYLLFLIWGTLCFLAFYQLVRGIGMKRIYRTFLYYQVTDKEIRFMFFFRRFCIKRIFISNIKQILRFSESKEKLKIFLSAEHWELNPFQPMICIQVKTDKKNKWLLLSPENVNRFISEIRNKG